MLSLLLLLFHLYWLVRLLVLSSLFTVFQIVDRRLILAHTETKQNIYLANEIFKGGCKVVHAPLTSHSPLQSYMLTEE